MKKLFQRLTCILLHLVCLQVAAQQKYIHIEVYDASTQQVIENANVYWKDTAAIGSVTNASGMAMLIYVPNQKAILIDYIGYKLDTLYISAGTMSYIVRLHSDNILNTIEVTAKKQSNYISSLETKKTEKITYDEMKKAACCNLSESFQTNASIDIHYNDAVTGAKEIKLLGLSGLYVQNLMEGIPFMRRYSYALGMDQLPAPWINAISISKGIPSVKNGYEGITGSLSVDLKNGFNNKHKLYFDMFGNSDSRVETNLQIHHKIKQHLSTSLMMNGAFRPMNMDRNNDGFLDNPKIKQYNFLHSWNFNRPDKGIEGQYSVKAVSEERSTGQISGKHTHHLDSLPLYTIEINTKRAEAFAKTGFLLKKNDASIGTQFSGVYHQQQSNYGAFEYNVSQFTFTGNLLFQTDIKNEDHILVTGFSIAYDNLHEKLDSSKIKTLLVLPGIFAEYTYKYGNKITLIGALRLDYSNQTSFQYAPRIHARFNLDKKENTTLRISAGRGFRIPNVFNDNQSLLASSRKMVVTEKPSTENAWNYGVSLQQKFKLRKHLGSITIDYFRTDFTKQVIVDIENSDALATIYNMHGKSFSNSLLAEWNIEIYKGLDFKATYKWEDVRITYHQILLQKALHFIHRGLVALSYKIPSDKLQFDLNVPIFGKARLPNSFSGDTGNRYTKPYVLLNLQMLAKFKIGEFYVGVENMANYKQKNPILGSPSSVYFDTHQVYAPVSGIMGYGGLRIIIP